MQPVPIHPNSDNHTTPWYAQRWPWLLMLGPFVVVLAGIYTGWLAYFGQDALVVDDYYKQGKAINQDLRRDRAAASLGLQLQLDYDPAAGNLTGKLQGISGPQTGQLLIQLIHSTLPQKDIQLIVQADRNGAFSVALPMLEIARWQVQVENAQRDWRLNDSWIWPQQKNLLIKAGPVSAG